MLTHVGMYAMSTTSLYRRENSLHVLAGAMKAVILIGGPRVCTQFRPLSLEVPMPLFPVAGAPLLQHHVEACTKDPEVREILLIGFYQQSREMTRFIQDMQREYGIPIRYLQEYCSLGTAGGIYHFRDQILRGNPRAFFVLNSDVCCDFPVTKMSEFHAQVVEKTGCIILGTEANETQAVNYGCIVENPETHEVLHYVEKPETFVSNIINAGAYLFTPEIFKQLGKVFQANHENELIPEHRRDSIDLERSLLAPLAGTGQLFVFKMTTGFWSQVKNAGSAIYANRLYLCSFHNDHPERLATGGPDLPNIIGHVRIHPTAMVDPTATLGPNVYVGAGVTIGPGARVKEAIILDRAEVREHSCILHSIIGWDCILGAWSRVEGSPNDPNPNDPLARVSTESLFNREGKLNPSITILGQGVNVHSELMVLNSIVLPHRELNSDFRNQIIL